MPDMGLLLFFAALIGACLGSFANAAALRSLSGADWVSRPSACFNCGNKLTIVQNLPFFGYLHHGGKAACCGAVLPQRYIWVEAAVAALVVIAVIQLPLPVALVFLPFIVLQTVLFLTDLDDYIIPDWTSLGGAMLGLFLNLFAIPGLPIMLMALAGGAAGFALIYGINFLYKMLRGRDGLGFGDVKLMMCYGIWLGPYSILPILFAASMAGAVFGIFAILWAKRHGKDMPLQVPFGCFLAPSALIWLFFAPSALRGF